MNGDEFYLRLFYWTFGIYLGLILGYSIIASINKWPYNNNYGLIFMGSVSAGFLLFFFYFFLEISFMLSFLLAVLTALFACWAGIRAGAAAQATQNANLEAKRKGEFNYKRVMIIGSISVATVVGLVFYIGLQILWLSIVSGIVSGLLIGWSTYYTYR